MSTEKSKAKGSESSYAYTPGLKVTKQMTILKDRTLPIPGEVSVKVGDAVGFDTIVAKTSVPGDVEVVNVTQILQLTSEEINLVMKKKVGDAVKKDDLLASYSTFFGMMTKTVKSPVDGTIESISDASGRVMLRGPSKPLILTSYIPGVVTSVRPSEGVVIEANAALLHGIFGIGEEIHGKIKIAVKSPSEELKPEMITAEDKGKILVGGSFATEKTLRRAVECGVKGVVIGGIRDVELFNFIGREIGVAITGRENVGLTFMITEGFGEMTMSDRSFNLLKYFEGQEAAMNGATQIRAGVQRPEIIIPHSKLDLKDEESLDLSEGMTEGTPVRIIGEPYFGAIGVVSGLPVELQVVDTESLVRVAEIELQDKRRVIVPRANIEIIEE